MKNPYDILGFLFSFFLSLSLSLSPSSLLFFHFHIQIRSQFLLNLSLSLSFSGVARNASAKDIKAKYFQLAKIYHPGNSAFLSLSLSLSPSLSPSPSPTLSLFLILLLCLTSSSYHIVDVNKEPDAQKKFVEITNAYAILSDAQKRAQCDAELDGNGILR